MPFNKKTATSGEAIMESTSRDEDEMTGNDILDLLPTFAKGPLDPYRQNASFQYKNMALYLDGEDILKYKVIYLTVLLPKLKKHVLPPRWD